MVLFRTSVSVALPGLKILSREIIFMFVKKAVLIVSMSLFFVKCNPDAQKAPVALVDKQATCETKNLYQNLFAFSRDKILFGHQDDPAYGILYNSKKSDERSDVKIILDDYPAVAGWDIGHLETGSTQNLDSVSFDLMKKWINDIFEMNGINTISWHADNPVSGGTTWDASHAVSDILPNGMYHSKYIAWLDTLGGFFNSLQTTDGTRIPIIFRPFHEHTHSAFWWGQNNCTTDEFIQLWRFTVDYLKNNCNVHHLIYAYSPHDVKNYSEYMERYPGDDYVDVMGVDYYFWGEVDENNIAHYIDRLVLNCKMAERAAREHHKIAALTETGRENLDINNWFTSCLLNPLKEHHLLQSMVYALVWRNARKNHHFAPYKGHASEADFKRFYNDKTTVFLKNMRNLYKKSDK